MTATADFVIAGAGHNSLITAAYLAAAGYSCAIVDARAIPGGGATTEELFPGYHVDTCSTGHTLIQVNPLIRNDELGLVSKYGLSYIDPEPVEVVAFPDGETLTMSLDLDATCAEIARFSERDAEAYRRVISEYEEIKRILGATRFRPVGHGPTAAQLLADHPRAGTWTRRSMMSARDLILHEFESPHARAFMAWMASQTAVPIDGAGTGLLAYQIVSGRQARSWSIPAGGSGRLIDALVGYLSALGATIECDVVVDELLLEDGRCIGVRAEDGREWRARLGVISTIHVKHLVDMAPAEAWGADFTYGVETYHPGVPFFGGYFATSAPVEFATHAGPRSAVSSGCAGWLEDQALHLRAVSNGEFVESDTWVLVATPTLADPGRAPDGHHTVKMVTFNAYDPGGGPDKWEAMKDAHLDRQLEHLRRFAPGFTDDVILDRVVKSPVDVEAQNRHMFHGAPHGGDRSIAFTEAQRPVPGWAQHRMPIDGLYQTGGTTHPGGSITGAPGRNAAMVVLEDLGRDPSEVMEVT
ncbi:MAG: NAD(P)/FAD-dependent oxidoreductase [Acidimicrobiia bacterium]|nr:NAD(P)/FAD-dependent oxidoreductase [Acidimicrobiia bacterium]